MVVANDDVGSAFSAAIPTVHSHANVSSALTVAFEALHDHRRGVPVSNEWRSHMASDLMYIISTLRHLVALGKAYIDADVDSIGEILTTLLMATLVLVHVTSTEGGRGDDEDGPVEVSSERVSTPQLPSSLPWMRRLRGEACLATTSSAVPVADTLAEPSLVSQLHELALIIQLDPSPLPMADLHDLVWQYSERAVEGLRHALLTVIEVPRWDVEIDVETAVESIVLAADAELGMQVFKEMLLSFSLPRRSIKVRHTLLLPRETVTETTREYPKFVEHAHMAALQGPSRVWNHGVALSDIPSLERQEVDASVVRQSHGAHFLHNAESIRTEEETRRVAHLQTHDAVRASYVERTCVLLAGLAMVFAPTSIEARKGIAFRGRVLLPFLSLPTCSGCGGTIELLGTGEWAYVRRDTVEEGAGLIHKEHGVRGLARCASLMLIDGGA
jgi:hypothetical protein